MDFRDTDLYREAEALHRAIRRPGTGQISDAAEINASPAGKHVVFTATFLDKADASPATRIAQVDLATGEVRVLSFGPNSDRLPKYSPDGKSVAFLSDRHASGDFQLYLLDLATGAAEPTARVEGWVEYFHWSLDGRRVLLGVAGHGADISGGQGAITSKQKGDSLPNWMPTIETGDESYRWRRAWVCDLATHSVRQVSKADRNIWEAVWCGPNAIAAIVSPSPSEGSWYSATLERIDLETGEHRVLYKPRDQLGWPSASPSGHQVAVVEAVCSDRWIVSGDLKIIDAQSGKVDAVRTAGVDVTHVDWRSENAVLLAGHRGFDTVLGVLNAGEESFEETWSSREITGTGRYVTVSGIGTTGDCVLIGESFVRAPEIGVVRQGRYHTARSFDLGYNERAKAIRSVECITWKSPDGLEIQGWLIRPAGPGPHPLVMNIHGGPVWQWRPAWLGRPRAMPMLMLVEHGYAVFYPNPRGSSGQGQDFIRRVVGDMGGADTHDYLSGLDHLVATGRADLKRLGVTGVSYGGFMASWLVTQDTRFAAAIPVAPSTNQVTQHLTSNIAQFVELFLGDHYRNATGKYFQRSPIMFASKAKTPTMNVCGALDRCTPPTEALQFHNALLENGVQSVLATYPLEGHGIHSYPAALDYAARVVGWFEKYMPAK